MISVELSRAADADLDSILDYGIEAHGREAAEAYAENATRITKQIAMEQKQCGFGAEAETQDKTDAGATT